MSTLDYKAKFHALSIYALSNSPTKFERIWQFSKGLAGYLQKATTFLVLAGGTFSSVVDHTSMVEHKRHKEVG